MRTILTEKAKRDLTDLLSRENNLSIYALLYARYETDLLLSFLKEYNIFVTLTDNEKDFRDHLLEHKYHIVLTDIPDDPKTTAPFVREVFGFAYPTPLIVIGSHSSQTMLQALNAGAICCLSQNTSFELLVAQIKTILRNINISLRHSTNNGVNMETEVSIGDYKLNKRLSRLYYKGENIPLPPEDFALLAMMVESPDNIINSHTLCMRVFGTTGTKALAQLGKSISEIKAALGPKSNIEILKQPGIGYGVSIIHDY